MIKVSVLIVVLVLVASGVANAQEPASPPASVLPGISFFEPVAFKDVHQVAVYKDTNGNLYVAPTGLKVEQDSMSFIYDGSKSTARKAVLNLHVRPTLSEEMSDADVLALLKREYPNSTIRYLEPRLARLEATIVGEKQTITPYSATLRLGQDIFASIRVGDEGAAFFLTGRTTDLAIGQIQLTYTVRGLEIGLDGGRSVVDRSVVITGYVNGGCARMIDSYVDAKTGRVGCRVPIQYGREDITQLQVELTRLSLYSGTVDGVNGRLTHVAIRKAQRILKLPENGKLDYSTVRRILNGELAKQIASPGST